MEPGPPGPDTDAVRILRYQSNDGERRRGRSHREHDHHALLHAQRGQARLFRGQE